jgi:AbrB family looped-hinge helix DNA binding protein
VGILFFEYKSVIVLGDKGRIVIPEKIRKDMEIIKGDDLVIEYQDGIIKIYATWDREEIQK